MCIRTIKNTSMGIEHLHIILSTRCSPRRALVRTLKTTEMHQKVDFFTFYSFHEKGRGSQARTAERARVFSARHKKIYFQGILNTSTNPEHHVYIQKMFLPHEQKSVFGQFRRKVVITLKVVMAPKAMRFYP